MQLVMIMNNTIASSVAFAYYTLRELLHTVAIVEYKCWLWFVSENVIIIMRATSRSGFTPGKEFNA